MQIPILTSSDYFEKNPEFTAWLRESKGTFFNDLPGPRARELFDDFLQLWNDRDLPAALYRGIESTEARRSKHSWGFKGQQKPDTQLRRGRKGASNQPEGLSSAALTGPNDPYL